MLPHFDTIVVFLLGGLLINPRRFRTVHRAALAALCSGAATAAVYLLLVRPLLGWTGEVL